MTGSYRLIDHTADFGLEVFGPDQTTLFETAASALFDLLTDPLGSKVTDHHRIDVSGNDWPDLMVNWLRELLYLFNGEGRVVSRMKITSIQETCLTATLSSEDFDPEKHEVLNEIKAVTYHQITVGPHGDGWRARVIFDI